MKKHTWIALGLTAVLAMNASILMGQTSAPAPTVKPVDPKNIEKGDQAVTGAGVSTASQPAGAAPKQEMDWKLPAILFGAVILMFVFSGRNRKKEEKKRKEMLTNLKKGDKVTMIGGELGTVIEVRDDEVTVKVDETNNVRMRFARWAIRGVGEEGRAEGTDQKKA